MPLHSICDLLCSYSVNEWGGGGGSDVEVALKGEGLELMSAHTKCGTRVRGFSHTLAPFLDALPCFLDTLPCFIKTLSRFLDPLDCFVDTPPHFLDTRSSFLDTLQYRRRGGT